MLTAQSSEQRWITRASMGDLDAFNQLVLIYQDVAYRHACSLTSDPDTAEDIAQEGFIKAFQNIRDFRGGSFRAWLLTIMTNISRDKWRRMKKHPTLALFPEDEDGETIESPGWIADGSVSVEATVQLQEESHRLYQMLDELPAAHRNIITLIDIFELDYTEAADVLKVPLGTVKSRLARARLQMQSKLRDAGYVSTSFTANGLVSVAD